MGLIIEGTLTPFFVYCFHSCCSEMYAQVTLIGQVNKNFKLILMEVEPTFSCFLAAHLQMPFEVFDFFVPTLFALHFMFSRGIALTCPRICLLPEVTMIYVANQVNVNQYASTNHKHAIHGCAYVAN